MNHGNDGQKVMLDATPFIEDKQVTSNDTEGANSISNGKAPQQENFVSEALGEKLNVEQTMQNDDLPSIEQGGSNDFGSYMSAANNNSSGFDGIPSPEKGMSHLQSKSNDSFDFTLLRANGGEIEEKSVKPITLESKEPMEMVSVEEEKQTNLNDDHPQKLNVSTGLMTSSKDNLIPSPTEGEALDSGALTQQVRVEDTIQNPSQDNSELLTINLTEEESTTKEAVITASAGKAGLIPSPEKIDSVLENGSETKPQSEDGLALPANLGAMSLSADSEIPTMNNLGIMNQSKDSNNGIGSMNSGAMSQSKSIEGMSSGVMSQSTEGVNLGIMSQSADGGI